MTDGKVEAGHGGVVLIDPARLKILNNSSGPSPDGSAPSVATVGKGFIEDRLNSDSNVALVASDEIFADGPLTIHSSSTASLSIKIGTLALRGSGGGSLGSFSPDGPSGGCGSVGVCIHPFGRLSPTRAFTPDTAGDIHLAGVDIQIGGDLTIQAGTQLGDVAIGNVLILGGFRADAGTPGGSVVVGNVDARRIDINQTRFNTLGSVHVGSLHATANADHGQGPGDAVIAVSAGDIEVINAEAASLQGALSNFSSIVLNAQGRLDVLGSLRATNVPDIFRTTAISLTAAQMRVNGLIDIFNAAGIADVSLTGGQADLLDGVHTSGSLGSTISFNLTGPLGVHGNVIAEGLLAGNATVSVESPTVNFGGDLRATTSGTALIESGQINTTGIASVAGDIVANAGSAASVQIFGTTVNIGGSVLVGGHTRASISIGNETSHSEALTVQHDLSAIINSGAGSADVSVHALRSDILGGIVAFGGASATARVNLIADDRLSVRGDIFVDADFSAGIGAVSAKTDVAGRISATSKRQASINFTGNNGFTGGDTLAVHGNVSSAVEPNSVFGSGGAFINISAARHTDFFGNLSAFGTTNANVTLVVANGATVNVAGNTTVGAFQNAVLNLFGLTAFGFGGGVLNTDRTVNSITFNGDIKIDGGNSAILNTFSVGGLPAKDLNLNLNGNTTIKALNGLAGLFGVVNGAIDVAGLIDLSVDHQGGEAIVALAANGPVDINAPIHTRASGFARVSIASGTGITVRELIEVSGIDSAGNDHTVINLGIIDGGVYDRLNDYLVHTFGFKRDLLTIAPKGAGGFIRTLENGLLKANAVGLGWDSAGAVAAGTPAAPVNIDVRTDAN